MTQFAIRIVVVVVVAVGGVCPRGGEQDAVDGVDTLGEGWGIKVRNEAAEVI